jgi:hypothetical protein
VLFNIDKSLAQNDIIVPSFEITPEYTISGKSNESYLGCPLRIQMGNANSISGGLIIYNRWQICWFYIEREIGV